MSMLETWSTPATGVREAPSFRLRSGRPAALVRVVPQVYANQIKVGDAVTVTLRSGWRTIPGHYCAHCPGDRYHDPTCKWKSAFPTRKTAHRRFVRRRCCWPIRARITRVCRGPPCLAVQTPRDYVAVVDVRSRALGPSDTGNDFGDAVEVLSGLTQ